MKFQRQHTGQSFWWWKSLSLNKGKHEWEGYIDSDEGKRLGQEIYYVILWLGKVAMGVTTNWKEMDLTEIYLKTFFWNKKIIEK